MPLGAGLRLGVYEIQGQLGAGGMGEVYRARDTQLNRDVALKFLPEGSTLNPDRLARFKREAQILASLNHPNIGAIYGFEESNGVQALVLELVEGPTLADRIAGGPVPLDEALPIARQIAEALEAAHEHGIIHRDLKPSNVKLRPDGTIKVLDFGLAKVLSHQLEPGDVDAPTITAPFETEAGRLLGTAAYMSPEQASGQAIDTRTDMWAFGCMLYETLTGERAFRGETVTDLLVAVMKDEPAWSLLPDETPGTVRALLQQCLRKPLQRRLHDARAARLTLEDAIAEPARAPSSPGARMLGRPLWIRVAPLLAASVFAGGIGIMVLKPATPVDRSVSRLLFDVQPAEGFSGSVVSTRPSRTAMALSPDGRTIVFSGVRGAVSQLFRRRLDEREATPMSGTEGGRGPFFSPDGQWIGFWADNKLKKVPAAGGPAVVISDAPAIFGLFGANWGSDGSIVFSARGAGIARVTASGGIPDQLSKADISKGEGRHILPHVLPGGKTVIYTVMSSPYDWMKTSIVAQSVATGERRTLLEGGADARFVSSGHLLYMKSGTLMSVPFDAERLELKGPPVAAVDNVMQAIGAYHASDETGAGQFDVSRNGTLVYTSGGRYPDRLWDLVWVDRSGTVTQLPVPAVGIREPRVSPNGERIAFVAGRGSYTESDIWVYNIGAQNAIRLTTESTNHWATWSPDSRSLVFTTEIGGVLNLARISADGSGRPERLTTREHAEAPASWSSAANALAFLVIPQSPTQIWILPMDGDRKPRPFLQSPFSLSHPEFSPNGRWLAYVSPESGRNEIYVQGYPEPGEKIRISTEGGHSPVWARNGRELFFLRPSSDMLQVMVVEIDARDGFHAGKPRVMFEGPFVTLFPLRGYDVMPDGRRFVMSTRNTPEEPPFTQMHIILNWHEELKRLAPTK